LRAEHAITRLLAVAEDINEAADGVLKILMESLDLDAGIFWQLDASRQVLRAASVRLRPGREYLAKFARRRRSAPLAKGEELAGRAWRELLPVCILVEPGPTEVSEVGGMPTRSGLAFPIQSGGTAHGALEFWSHRSLHLNTPVLNMLSAIGSELGQFIQRRDAQAALRRAHDELEVRVQRRTAELQLANSDLEASIVERKRLEQELLEITEKERRRIGLDLHDDLGQKLSGIALMAKGLELRLTQCHSAEAQRARKIQELVQQTMNHTSDLAHDLAALDFGEKNLRAALRHLAVRVAELFGIRCRFQAEGRPAFLDAPSARQISKIAQEAVTNAIKHGKAQDVEIQLVTGQKELTLTVKNDGLPFPDLEGCRAGMGVRIMNYRAHLLNGTLEIRAPAGVGTILECRIPLASRSPRSNRRARATHPKTRRIL
jgi:signal transduction histidine kinase